ncbi:helix-turn-helix domain-containing protein [Pseudarthrobacter sp. NPDC057230]|uniref:helix-turn-helix domain-containing protein n=1 Tax=Micrococcaceae TaxID=1268 RepID=UPI001910D184
MYRREPNLTDGQIFTSRELITHGVPKAAVARELGVSRQTLYSALNGQGRYASNPPTATLAGS